MKPLDLTNLRHSFSSEFFFFFFKLKSKLAMAAAVASFKHSVAIHRSSQRK